ncbi:protein ALP1-like [Arachis hypogaea]|uniref:protein ALP1-like n=1 Tax=Arachis hypogaea TaxID=3818 RepID=UPI000DEE019A|nr:protein ALP1-like [Arachis hypogaea]
MEMVQGALDGTHIKVNVLDADKPRYRNRKGDITTNVLGVVAPNMQFIYVLAGWEGSAADSRVLQDALFHNGFSVPQGHYYLCDAGYMNCEGFLAPYKRQKYHLSEFNPHNQPSTAQKLFNMKHSQARNVIERAFGVLKARWRILRKMSFYPIKTQGIVIIACCLLHNHIRRVMVVDPIDEIVDQNMLGVDGGINLHKKYGTNGGEDIIHDNCVYFSMYEVVYCNIDFIFIDVFAFLYKSCACMSASKY